MKRRDLFTIFCGSLLASCSHHNKNILPNNNTEYLNKNVENTKKDNLTKVELEKTKTKDTIHVASIDTAVEKFGRDKFIYINLPSQILRFYDNGKEIFNSLIIVGSKDSPTPVMSSFVTGVKLHPSWASVPYGKIEKKFTKMLFSDEKKYLEEAKVKWYKRSDGSYQFYQNPGDNNLLGKVRIEMINNKHIYLHDTNRPDLFNLEKRTISGGCIRVKNWKKLSSLILDISDQEFDKELQNIKTRILPAKSRVPIHIVYFLEEVVDGKKYKWSDLYS